MIKYAAIAIAALTRTAPAHAEVTYQLFCMDGIFHLNSPPSQDQRPSDRDG
jgi:hypothetical protein